MKPFLLAIPLFMACEGPASQQVVKDHQGRVRALVTRVNGDKEGPVRFFDSAGNLETTGEYAGDSRHGSWISVDAKGTR